MSQFYNPYAFVPAPARQDDGEPAPVLGALTDDRWKRLRREQDVVPELFQVSSVVIDAGEHAAVAVGRTGDIGESDGEGSDLSDGRGGV